MGCANSSLLPSSVLENGEHVAPPYELKQASDKLTQEGQGLLGTAKRMFSSDNLTSKIKEAAGDITDSAPVQQVIGGAVNVKDAAINKIHGAGEAVKQTIGSFTHQTEEKFGTFAQSAEDKLGSVVTDVENQVGEAVKKVEDLLPGTTPPSSPVDEPPMVEERVEPKPEPEMNLELEPEEEAMASAPEPEEPEVEESKEEEMVNLEKGEVDEVITVETDEE